MKKARNPGAYLALFAGILAIVALFLYGSVIYRMDLIRFLLLGAAAVGLVHFLLAGSVPRLAAYFPIAQSVLLFSAGVWGSNLMINQIAYVVSGLDGIETILSWILFTVFVIVAGLISLISAFWRIKAQEKNLRIPECPDRE